MFNGWLNIYKNKGVNSTRVVSIIKKIVEKNTKVGHSGTLDPFATGVLPIAIGNATKTVEYMMDCKKTYRFVMHFGIATDSYDVDGEVVDKNDFMPSLEELQEISKNFIGTIEQTPPKYSALKINGKRACDIMRDGGDVELAKREITIHSLEFTGLKGEKEAEFIVECSRGTYVRSLAVDMAKQMDAIAHVVELERLKTGVFSSSTSLNMDEISLENIEKNLMSVNDVLEDIPSITVNTEEERKLSNGLAITISSGFAPFLRVLDRQNKILCLANNSGNLLKSCKWLKDD